MFFSLLTFSLFCIGGCPVAMDKADGKLVAVNNSEIKVVFAVKDARDGMISRAVVEPRSEKSLDVVNEKWNNIIPIPSDYIKVFSIEYSKWDQTKGAEQFQEQSSLKYSVYTRSQLDSAGWKIVYP